jgi:hypothetical protein
MEHLIANSISEDDSSNNASVSPSSPSSSKSPRSVVATTSTADDTNQNQATRISKYQSLELPSKPGLSAESILRVQHQLWCWSDNRDNNCEPLIAIRYPGIEFSLQDNVEFFDQQQCSKLGSIVRFFNQGLIMMVSVREYSMHNQSNCNCLGEIHSHRCIFWSSNYFDIPITFIRKKVSIFNQVQVQYLVSSIAPSWSCDPDISVASSHGSCVSDDDFRLKPGEFIFCETSSNDIEASTEFIFKHHDNFGFLRQVSTNQSHPDLSFPELEAPLSDLAFPLKEVNSVRSHKKKILADYNQSTLMRSELSDCRSIEIALEALLQCRDGRYSLDAMLMSFDFSTVAHQIKIASLPRSHRTVMRFIISAMISLSCLPTSNNFSHPTNGPLPKISTDSVSDSSDYFSIIAQCHICQSTRKKVLMTQGTNIRNASLHLSDANDSTKICCNHFFCRVCVRRIFKKDFTDVNWRRVDWPCPPCAGTCQCSDCLNSYIERGQFNPNLIQNDPKNSAPTNCAPIIRSASIAARASSINEIAALHCLPDPKDLFPWLRSAGGFDSSEVQLVASYLHHIANQSRDALRQVWNFLDDSLSQHSKNVGV